MFFFYLFIHASIELFLKKICFIITLRPMYIVNLIIFTSTKEVMFLPVSVVGWFVTRITQKLSNGLPQNLDGGLFLARVFKLLVSLSEYILMRIQINIKSINVLYLPLLYPCLQVALHSSREQDHAN